MDHSSSPPVSRSSTHTSQHSRHARIARSLLTVLFVSVSVSVAASCERSSTAPRWTPLYGRRYAGLSDSLGRGIPQPFSPQGSGVVTGTIVGPSAAGTGNDGLLVAPRIPNAVVRVYPILNDEDPLAPDLGPLLAETIASNEGHFSTPVLESTVLGYVFTFTPPPGSAYAGGWVRSNVWSSSVLWRWWVTLPPRD